MPQQPEITELANSDDDSPLSEPDSDYAERSARARAVQMDVDGLQATSTSAGPSFTTENAGINDSVPLLQRIAPIPVQAPTQIPAPAEVPIQTGNRAQTKNSRLQVSALLNQNMAGPSNSNFDYNLNSGLNARPSRGRVQRTPMPVTSTSTSSGSAESVQKKDEEVMDPDVRDLLGLPALEASIPNGTHNASTEKGKEGEESKPNIEEIDSKNTKTQSISEYQCPICFSPPTRACMTKCGHVMCGQCLFSAVKAAKQRHVRLYGRGPGPDGEGKVSRCPVCRAVMKGWDGKGGGVIGLKLKFASASDLSH